MKNRAACAHFIKIFEVFMQKIGLRMAGVMWVWFCSQGVAMAERVLAGNRVEMQDLTLNLLALKQFLSLYSVVRDDAVQGAAVAGSRGGLAITNSTVMRNEQSVDVSNEIRSALFGGGMAANALINKVLIGGTGTQNPLTNIRNSLTNLGIDNSVSSGHQNHYHIYLRPPTALRIEPAPMRLEATQTATQSTTEALIAPNSVETQFDQSQAMENLMMDAFVNTSLTDFDRPALISMAESNSQPIRDVTYCRDIMLSVPEGRNDIALFYHPAFKSIPKGQETAIVKMVQAPKQGNLYFNADFRKGPKTGFSDPNPVADQAREALIKYSSWYFHPIQGQVAKDRAVFEIQAGSKKFKLTVNFWIAGIPEEAIDAHTECKKLKMHLLDKKVSGTIEQWQKTQQLSALLSAASAVMYSFADLPGTAVGETTGEGASATITLDTNAAGHGWYVDPTPLDNTDDYLPTSNPNIWQAKAGSDAAGKMDMLSVLLHEYGHALGLEHSAQLGDFMNTSLQPGQRRLPSSEELALMGQLPLGFAQPNTGNTKSIQSAEC